MDRNCIAACAREWVGTRFHHQGRLKRTEAHKGGVDCLGLIIGVARELNLRSRQGMAIAELDKTSYAHQPDTRLLKTLMQEHLVQKERAGMQPGDVLLFSMKENIKHAGIITFTENKLNESSIMFVHAFAPARAVVEMQCDDEWQARLEAVFAFPLTD